MLEESRLPLRWRAESSFSTSSTVFDLPRVSLSQCVITVVSTAMARRRTGRGRAWISLPAIELWLDPVNPFSMCDRPRATTTMMTVG